jgi:large subunit ribosomal protein L3
LAAIIGRKLGMTQTFTEDGERISVTVIEAGPCPVTAVREPERDGYRSVQLAFGETRETRITKPELGHLKKAGAPPMRTLVEFRSADPDANEQELKIGDQVTVAAFEKGQRVKVRGRSKGKGFQGTIRRHGHHRGPVSHGSHNVRAPGSIGASATPARVIKGVKMPGQMGNRRVTQRGLEVVDVDAERNLLLLRGAVPGPDGGVVEVRSEGSRS